jgi:hypothetical protein
MIPCSLASLWLCRLTVLDLKGTVTWVVNLMNCYIVDISDTAIVVWYPLLSRQRMSIPCKIRGQLLMPHAIIQSPPLSDLSGPSNAPAPGSAAQYLLMAPHRLSDSSYVTAG